MRTRLQMQKRKPKEARQLTKIEIRLLYVLVTGQIPAPHWTDEETLQHAIRIYQNE